MTYGAPCLGLVSSNLPVYPQGHHGPSQNPARGQHRAQASRRWPSHPTHKYTAMLLRAFAKLLFHVCSMESTCTWHLSCEGVSSAREGMSGQNQWPPQAAFQQPAKAMAETTNTSKQSLHGWSLKDHSGMCVFNKIKSVHSPLYA